MKILHTIQAITAASVVAMTRGGSGCVHAEAVKPHSRGEVRLGVTDLSFHRATGAVVAGILERMGFKVTRSFSPHEENFDRLRQGEIDMIASAWLPSSHGVYKGRVEAVAATRELGLHYEPYALWGVPDFVPESQVATVTDLLKPAVKAKMTKTIQGINPGAGITRFSIKMMDEYQLNDAGYRFQAGTQAECVAAFENAVDEKRWVVVPLWHPQFLHHKHQIRALEDPKKLLGGKDRAVLLARQDSLEKLFTKAEIKQLDDIRLSNAKVAELDYAINRDNKTADEAAQAWLTANYQARETR